MKELKITELMREYTDDEFNIEGENAADTEKVLKSVMGQVKPGKKIKPLFKVLIAAAAAAVLAGAVTAGTAITGYFVTATGRQIEWDYEYGDDGSVSGWRSTTTKELEDVLTLQDGRLYFNLKGESTDITDLIDRTTPYIYTYELPQSEKPAYVIAGGTTEEYAVVDLVYTEGTGWDGIGIVNGSMRSGMVNVVIDNPFHGYDKTLPLEGWYLADNYTLVDYEIFDEAQNVVRWYNYNAVTMYPTWRQDNDAWLIEALVQLELMELPKTENFVLPDIAFEDDTVTLWGKDITGDISEETAYVYRKFWGASGWEKLIIVGGTPGDFGWAFVEKRLVNNRHDIECWTIACDNITDADGQLREWYLNAVEDRGYDLEELQRNHYFDK